MKSYVKIYGPPVLRAIRALETLAVDIENICIMDTIMLRDVPPSMAPGSDRRGGPASSPVPAGIRQAWVSSYYQSFGVTIPVERCRSILSDSGMTLGDYDFVFDWMEEPSTEQLLMLIERIDGALGDLGCYYTIETVED